jgi:Uma2 family endonuclease
MATMTDAIVRHKFSADQFEEMVRVGILTKYDRVELIRGEVLEMSPIGDRHAASVDKLTALFATRLSGRAIVRVQGPVRVDDYSVPEPDVTLLKTKPDYYASGKPRPREVLLVIEVSDSTYRHDRRVKIPLYAEDGIAEAWIVDLERQVVEVFRSPGPDGYADARTVPPEGALSPAAFPDVEFPAREILA